MSKTIELESRIDSVIAELRTSRDLISSARLALELDRLMEQAEADPGFWISEVARAPIVDRRSLELALLRLRALEARDFCAGVLALLLLVIERSQKSPSRVGEDAAAALLEALDQYGLDRFFVGQTFSSELGAGIVLHLARTWPALKLSALFRQLSPYLLFEYLREKEWVRSFFPGAAKLVEQVPEIFESSGYSLADPVELVDCAAALGELARVTEVIRSWPKPGARARAEARMAAILAERGSFDEALAWASISEPSPGVFLAEEADRQRQLGDLQRAKYLAGQILDTKVRMGCFSRVAWDFLRRQEANAAIECLRVVIDSIDEPSDLELILEEAPKMNEPGKIPGELAPEFDAMLAEMWSWSDRELEEARNRLQCALVEVWGYLGHRAKAWKLSGLVAASRERAELIASLVAFSGGEEDAAELLKKALKEARGLKVRWQRCAALLHVASAASRVRPAAAREIFSEVIALARELTDIDSTGLTESVQESIVEWLAGTPAFEGCDWCYFEMLEFIAETVSLRSLLTHAVVLGEKMDSDEVRSRWVGRFIEVAAAHEAAEALGLLARQSAARGLMDEAISCLENILESERVEFQLSLASQLWHQDRTHAQRLLDEAERIARKPTRERYDTRRFNVIFGLAGFGMVERAVALASLVRPAEERCRAFAELAFLSLGDLGIARRHLVTFLRTVKNRDLRERLPFDEGALVALSGELATFDPGGYRRLDLFDSALWRILPRVPEESRRILFLGTWFRLVVENLPIHEARPLLDKAQYRVLELKDQRARDEGIKQISRSLLQAGELGWVARLAEAFSSRFQYATLLCEVALIEARGGKEREAAEHLSRALDALANEKLKNDGSPHQILALPAIRALQNHELRDQSMALVLAPLLRIELDTERAKALLKLGEELVLGEPDPWVVQVLVELCLHIERAEMPRYALELEEHRIGLLAALGEFDEALAAAKAIDSSNWIREHSLLRIVLELARQGHAEVCFTVLGKIKTEEYRSKALKAIAEEVKEEEVNGICPTFLQWATKIENPIFRLEILETLVSRATWQAAFEEIRKNLEDFESRLHELLEYPDPGEGPLPMISLWAKLGQEDRVLALLGQVGTGRMAVRALEALIDTLAGLWKSSESSSTREPWLRELVAFIKDLDSSASRMDLFLRLAGVLSQIGLFEAAGGALERALAFADQERTPTASWIEMAAEVLEAPLEKRREWAKRLLDLAQRAEPSEQVRAYIAVAKVCFVPEHLAADRLEALQESSRVEYLRALMKAAFEHSPDPVGDIQSIVGLAQATSGLGISGVIWLGAALLKAGDVDTYQEIARFCPDGDLPLIVA